MILYHFTALERLEQIRSDGLTRGDVPLSPTNVINAVWLTSDKDPAGHGLSDGRKVTREEIIKGKAIGLFAPSIADDRDLYWMNKRAVRITVKIASSDRDLKLWSSWGRKRLSPEWFDRLSSVGGGHQKARTWYLCFRRIDPSEFVSVDTLSD